MAFFFFFIVLFGIIEAGHLMFASAEANAQVQKAGTGISAAKLSIGSAATTIEDQIVKNSTLFKDGDVTITNVVVKEPQKVDSHQSSVSTTTGYSMDYTVEKGELVVEYDIQYHVPLLFKLFTYESVEMTRHVKYDIPCQSAYEVVG